MEKNNAIKFIQGMVKKKDMLILPGTIVWQKDGYLRNSCPVIAKGDVKEYCKATDGGDSDVALKHGCIFLPGKENGKVIEWKGKKIGIEICADHSVGTIMQRKEKADIHIIVGCGATIYDSNAIVKDNGYVLLCDGSYHNLKEMMTSNRAMRNNKGILQPIKPIVHTPTEELYNLEI